MNGRIAYRAYAEAVCWRSVDGHVLPPWEQLRPPIRDAWSAAAEAVMSAFMAQLASRPVSELIGPDWEAHP